jgi:hypothetical protein
VSKHGGHEIGVGGRLAVRGHVAIQVGRRHDGRPRAAEVRTGRLLARYHGDPSSVGRRLEPDVVRAALYSVASLLDRAHAREAALFHGGRAHGRGDQGIVLEP